MFITDEDFKVVATEQTMKAITQADYDNKESAVLEAIEEMKGYLRPRYDCDKIFTLVGSERNRQLVMLAADIALYHMAASLPQRMGSEVREERYQRAVKWLEGVQAGKIVPDLPLASDDDSDIAQGGILAYGKGQDNNSW